LIRHCITPVATYFFIAIFSRHIDYCIAADGHYLLIAIDYASMTVIDCIDYFHY